MPTKSHRMPGEQNLARKMTGEIFCDLIETLDIR
jgi:hypothetical protein